MWKSSVILLGSLVVMKWWPRKRAREFSCRLPLNIWKIKPCTSSSFRGSPWNSGKYSFMFECLIFSLAEEKDDWFISKETVVDYSIKEVAWVHKAIRCSVHEELVVINTRHEDQNGLRIFKTRKTPPPDARESGIPLVTNMDHVQRGTIKVKLMPCDAAKAFCCFYIVSIHLCGQVFLQQKIKV